MPRMIDLIRVSAVPATLMHSAAKGALAVPPEEMIEILVYLATQNQIFGQQARFTLAGWDEAASKTVAANPKTPKPVLDYMIAAENLRPALLPALLENPSVPQGALIELASSGSRDIAVIMSKSARVARTQSILQALNSNPNLIDVPVAPVSEIAAPESETDDASETSVDESEDEVANVEISEIPPDAMEAAVQDDDGDLDQSLTAYLTEHEKEISAEGDKPFHAIGGVFDEIDIDKQTEEPQSEPQPAPTVPEPPSPPAEIKKKPAAQKPPGGEEKRGSVLQKIAKLDIKGRIQLAMKGNKEERSILIRDGTKLVALAVLESPKISDGEVERFAAQKNVLEAVLRGIPMKRRFAKHYPVIRNLVSNPRTPLDLSLGLMKHLLVQDLRNLAANKEVSDTVRKLALKMFKQKTDTGKKNA